jgi:hypothetical protein
MSNENFWFRTLFKLKLYEVSGESFQRLFNDIANYRYPDFQAVAPYGNQGDGGNDGWIPSEKRYFQVYGKKADSKTNLDYILDKATGDFTKIQNTWGKVDYYHFVYNDRFEGAPAPVIKAVSDLKITHNLTESTVWDSRKLERLFMELDDDKKECILGSIPVDIPDVIDSRMVADLLKHLADNISPRLLLLNQTAPDFNEKIQFNGLTEPVRDYLKYYSYQTQVVDDFLEKRDLGLKQSIATEMQEMYEESCKEISNDIEDAANIRYGWMMEKLIPENAKNHPHTNNAYRVAAQVILAKYFEICDIYEHPSPVTSS